MKLFWHIAPYSAIEGVQVCFIFQGTSSIVDNPGSPVPGDVSEREDDKND